jgi:hypothetical protein
MLSERAHTELEATLSALDPEADYMYEPDEDACPPGARIHIDGFEHSPFECDFMCCTPPLARAALIYWLVATYFSGSKDPLTIDGEPYVAIEPDEPCPPLEGWAP